MGLIEGYILFSVTTAIVGVIQLYRHVHTKLKETHKEDIVTKSPIRSYVLFGLFGMVTAPVLALVLLMPSITPVFIDAMYEGIIKEDTK